jgi:hypothetical protein
MHRRLIRFVAATALTFTVAGTVVAQEVVKNPCQDMTGGGGSVVLDLATGRYDFGFNIQTAGRCGGTLYTLYVFATEADCLAYRADSTTATPLAVLKERGTDVNASVPFLEPGLSAVVPLYVFGTSSQGRTTYDEAPNVEDGCEAVTIDPPSSGKWH